MENIVTMTEGGVSELDGKSTDEVMDILQSKMAEMPQADCPVTHKFTENQYIREIFMPAGSWIISKIHKTEHPYFIMQGAAIVFTEEDGEVLLKAPFCGITKPGTRRMLYITEDCVWATVHPTVKSDETLEEIEERIIEKRDITKIENECRG